MQDTGAPSSSKLATFAETLDERLASSHKVLVFSQFVKHLKLIEKHLAGAGIALQSLDGSIPARARAERIAAFQAGQGDVFLISLRAGGVGLHLTAADYVVHMDPWWNPAVEDQVPGQVGAAEARQSFTVRSSRPATHPGGVSSRRSPGSRRRPSRSRTAPSPIRPVAPGTIEPAPGACRCRRLCCPAAP